MQARLQVRGEVTVIELTGRVEIEAAELFRTQCLYKMMGRKLIFDMSRLNFVGSTGILPFLESLQDFAMRNPHVFKFCYVGSEFKKIFAATSLSGIEIFENIELAVSSYNLPVDSQAVVARMLPFKRDGSIFHDVEIIEPVAEAVQDAADADTDAAQGATAVVVHPDQTLQAQSVVTVAIEVATESSKS